MSSGGVNLDLQRQARQGFPEVVYARGKTLSQVVEAMQGLYAHHGHALATGVSAEMAAALPGATYHELSGLCQMGRMSDRPGQPAVICAGTSDLPVAEEAAQTLDYLGYKVTRLTDVGVAGIHRLMERLEELRSCDVILAVAGMEAALASVVGGLVPQPVIAVPTSIGYGTGLGGLAALMAMLNSCAAGVTVVNIDNGFGAAMAAHRLMNRPHP
jgi:NCAIR mutase (PurE)-related protein